MFVLITDVTLASNVGHISCNSLLWAKEEFALTKSNLSFNVPFFLRDAEIMQQKQKKADEGGKGGTKSK